MYMRLWQVKSGSESDMRRSQAQFLKEKARLVQIEGALTALVGTPPGMTGAGGHVGGEAGGGGAAGGRRAGRHAAAGADGGREPDRGCPWKRRRGGRLSRHRSGRTA